MANTDVSICSNALLLLGANGIDTFTDGTPEAEIASNFYPTIYESVLSERRWSWTVKQSQFSQLVTAPLAGYQKAYQVPADCIAVLKLYPDYIDFRMFENKLVYTDYDGPLYGEYQYKPSESLLPAYFVEYLEARCALKFCLPITENSTKLGEMKQLADYLGRNARLADGKQNRGVGFSHFGLIDARG